MNPDNHNASTALDEELSQRINALFRYAKVGRCVNGVAHDINNLLGVMMAYSELVALEEGLSKDSVRMLNEVTSSAAKCSQLVSAITVVARREFGNPVITDLSALLENAILIRNYAFRVAQVQLEKDLAKGLPSVVTDAPSLLMALLHLLANAEEAVEGLEERKILLGLAGSDEGFCIRVWNSGPQIREDIRVRMFEPHFTTKAYPHVGLGLAAAQETAESLGGSLRYDPLQGFLLHLPLEGPLGLESLAANGAG